MGLEHHFSRCFAKAEQNFPQLGEIEEAKDFLGRDLGWVLRVVRLRIDKSW